MYKYIIMYIHVYTCQSQGVVSTSRNSLTAMGLHGNHCRNSMCTYTVCISMSTTLICGFKYYMYKHTHVNKLFAS